MLLCCWRGVVVLLWCCRDAAVVLRWRCGDVVVLLWCWRVGIVVLWCFVRAGVTVGACPDGRASGVSFLRDHGPDGLLVDGGVGEGAPSTAAETPRRAAI